MGIEGLLAGHLLCERYRVETVIGRGGMGIVYRATDIRLEREVAVKVITAASAEVAGRARLRDRFQREARAIARLQHPNVVAVYDYGTDPRLDLDFLVLELLRGEDLASRLARTARLPVHLSTDILRQAARGLSAGHDAGVIHRDVKPGNLFLADAGGGRLRVALLDFGIVQLAAEPASGETMTHITVFGRAPHSPAYAAPEQLRGDPLTPACDVWALAVTGYQMLTGEKPFPEAAYGALVNGGHVEPPSVRERNPAVPDALDAVIGAALSPLPAERYRDARDFGNALERALGGEMPAAIPVHSAPRVPDLDFTRVDDDRTLLVDSPVHPPLPPAVPERSSVAPATATNRRGWLRRAGHAAWSLVVTTGAAALAAAFGYAFFVAYEQSHTEPFYASLIGMSIALPWAIHRLLGRRGSYFLALLGSAAAAVAAIRLVAPVAGLDAAVLLLPVGQVVASAWLLRLTRRADPEPEAALPQTAL